MCGKKMNLAENENNGLEKEKLYNNNSKGNQIYNFEDYYNQFLKRDRTNDDENNITIKSNENINKDINNNNEDKRGRIVQEILCSNFNCNNTYLNIYNFCPFCSQSNEQNRYYPPCINNKCKIKFRDKFGCCPNCGTMNSNNKINITNSKKIKLHDGNNLTVLRMLIKKYEKSNNNKVSNHLNNNNLYQKIWDYGLSREEIFKILEDKGIKTKTTNGVKFICDNLWEMGLIADIKIPKSNINNSDQNDRNRIIYVINNHREFKNFYIEVKKSRNEILEKWNEIEVLYSEMDNIWDNIENIEVKKSRNEILEKWNEIEVLYSEMDQYFK